ncbi:MAG: ABC transporter permease subunit [Alphaproteobacteria bacterium]|nr:ABC transporter permease subunit [Alphaproteobacteria bacterium]
MRLINQKISRPAHVALAALPFVLAIIAYTVASDLRLQANPADKLLPSFASMADAFWRMAAEPDRRSGDILLWGDTAASLARLCIGVGISTGLAVVLGIPIGLIPVARSSLSSFVSTLSLIPPITVLPVLFIMVGLGELSKISLIVFGTAPVMIRTIALAVAELPKELLIKAQTLGASTWQIILRVVLPQILPRVVVAIRLGLVPAWIFLISAEAIASTEGLGYRIFLVRRYLAMDIILPYVAWITVIAVVLDRGLLMLSRKSFRWAHLGDDAEGGRL